MSKEEEEQIIGRVVRESSESKRTIALLQVKVRDLASRLSAAATLLNDFYAESWYQRDSAKIDAIPTADDVHATMKELLAERARTQSLKGELKELGIE